MNEFRSPELDPSTAIAELHNILGRLQAEGATDEEVPFIQHVMQNIERGAVSPTEALRHVQKKLASRGNYH